MNRICAYNYISVPIVLEDWLSTYMIRVDRWEFISTPMWKEY